VRQNILTHTVNIIFRLMWSVCLTFASSILFILIAASTRAIPLAIDPFLQAMYGVFFPLLLLFSFLTVGTYVLGIVEPYRAQAMGKLRARVEKLSLENRALVTQGFRWTSVCLMLLLFLIVSSGGASYLAEPVKSAITSWFVPVYFILIFSFVMSVFLVDRLDWAVYNLEQFEQTHELSSLQKALKDYNKALGSTLSVRRLLTISQYVGEGFLIGSDKEKEDMTRQLHVLGTNLRGNNICDADKSLIDLSQLAEETVKKHREVLGFEARYPYRMRLDDAIRSSVGRAFPELMLVLVWIAVLMILSYFGVTKLIFPP
jgi:hypothetical protein